MNGQARRPGEAALDAWSIVHVVVGACMGALRTRRGHMLVLLTGWELLEVGLRRWKPGGNGFFEYESPQNIAADILVGAAGWALARNVWTPRAP